MDLKDLDAVWQAAVPDHAPSRTAFLRARAALMQQATQPEQAPAARPPRHSLLRRPSRLVVRLVGAGGLAAALAIAVAVAPVGTDEQGLTTGSPTLSGNSVILAAAAKAEQQPTGTYWYTNSFRNWPPSMPGKTKDSRFSPFSAEFLRWTAAKTGGGHESSMRVLPTGPRTAADRAAWRKAGFKASDFEDKVGKWETHPSLKGPGGSFSFQGFPDTKATLEQVRNLPTDPTELAKIVFSREAMPRTGAEQGKPAWDTIGPQKIINAAYALKDAPISPRVRAGLMRALAAQPGVHSIDTATDVFGRQGTALAADWPQQGLYGLDKNNKATWQDRGYVSREEIIFDKNTGGLLGTQEVIVKPGGLYRTTKPGTVIGSTAVRGSGWVNDKPALPTELPAVPKTP